MIEETHSARLQLVRDVAVLQFKLLVDGLRDALLIPVSLAAALLGLLRGGENPGLEFQRVLKLGRRSERWINLFGHQAPLGRSRSAGSLDRLLARVETELTEQYRSGRNAQEARAAINAALEDVAGEPPREGPEH